MKETWRGGRKWFGLASHSSLKMFCLAFAVCKRLPSILSQQCNTVPKRLSLFFHVDEKGRSVLAIPLQFWFDALLKGDNISLLKGRGVISEDIMKVSVREGMLRRSWSSGSSKPLLLLIPRLTIYPYEACRYRSFAISPESCPMAAWRMIRISLSGSFSLLEQLQRASDVKSNAEPLCFPTAASCWLWAPNRAHGVQLCRYWVKVLRFMWWLYSQQSLQIELPNSEIFLLEQTEFWRFN